MLATRVDFSIGARRFASVSSLRILARHGWKGDASPVRKELDVRIVVVIVTIMGSAELIKKLEADGWLFRRARGSHHVYAHPEKPGLVVVSHPRKDLGKGLAHQIMKAAGLN